MPNEKNFLTAQALTDGDLDGVVGGVSATDDEIPPEVMEALIEQRNAMFTSLSSSRKICRRCFNDYDARQLTWVDGYGDLCPACTERVRSGTAIELQL